MGAIGLLVCTQFSGEQSVWLFIACYSLATFGVEMALSPSWSFCMDIGGKRSGAVSASMNMIGNLGAAMSAVIFPLFVANVTIPFFAPETGTANSFFVFAAVMNVLAIVCWLLMDPKRELKEISKAALRTRLILFLLLIAVVAVAVIYVKLIR
jgi:ACS family glucarate transporter-like MFS transporter